MSLYKVVSDEDITDAQVAIDSIYGSLNYTANEQEVAVMLEFCAIREARIKKERGEHFRKLSVQCGTDET